MINNLLRETFFAFWHYKDDANESRIRLAFMPSAAHLRVSIAKIQRFKAPRIIFFDFLLS